MFILGFTQLKTRFHCILMDDRSAVDLRTWYWMKSGNASGAPFRNSMSDDIMVQRVQRVQPMEEPQSHVNFTGPVQTDEFQAASDFRGTNMRFPWNNCGPLLCAQGRDTPQGFGCVTFYWKLYSTVASSFFFGAKHVKMICGQADLPLLWLRVAVTSSDFGELWEIC